jgi:hypothetical protein
MSATILWADLLDGARIAARFIPAPFNVPVDIALSIASGLIRRGCTVEGCPADVRETLITESIPAEDVAMFKARSEAEKRVRGLDRASIRSRLDAPTLDEEFPRRPDGAKDLAEYERDMGDEDPTDPGGSAA